MTVDQAMDDDAFLPSGGIDDSSYSYRALPNKINGRKDTDLTSAGPDLQIAPIPRNDPLPSATSKLPPTLDHHLLRRLLQQNDLIRGAWEAERTYLETNRRRAEEVYQEERIIMDEERVAWDEEKIALLDQIKMLRGRIRDLEGENTALRATQTSAVPIYGVARGDQNDHSISVSAYSSPTDKHHLATQFPWRRSKSFSPDPLTLPPGLDGASRRPHFAKPRSALASPTNVPEQPGAIPIIDPRRHPQHSRSKDFLPLATEEVVSNAPVIDVHELDPDLDGIPLKAPAVQKSTFGSSSSITSPASPPVASDGAIIPEQSLSSVANTLPPRGHVMQALRAEELKRLTMHAGHTPSHSLSKLGTNTGTDNTDDADLDEEEPEKDRPVEKEVENGDQMRELQPEDDISLDDHPEERLEAMDDVKLKGPLMIKNIPAQDEIFFDQLNKKLENITHGAEDPLPTVISSPAPEDEDDGIYSVSGSPDLSKAMSRALIVGDASHDVETGTDGPGSDPEAPAQGKVEVERDVPLKLRGTNNFGAPFGVA